MSCSTVSRTILALLALVSLPLPAAASAEAPHIGPGDRLEIRVWREPDLSGEYVVGVDGRLHHVLAGALPAAGETTEGLAEALRARLERDYLREARVAVTLITPARREALVVGAVARPGAHAIPEDARLLDLLAAAGGLAEDASGEGTLLRGASGALPPVSAAPGAEAQADSDARRRVDLRALVAGSDLSANWPIAAGDVLFVAPRAGSGGEADARVRVVGEVARAGSYPLEKAATLLDAVLAAGGLQEWAAGNRARLVRGSGAAREEIPVRLGDLLAGRGEQPNLELEDGDLIVVPESFF